MSIYEILHALDLTKSANDKISIGMLGVQILIFQNTFDRSCDENRLEIQSRKCLRKSNHNVIMEGYSVTAAHLSLVVLLLLQTRWQVMNEERTEYWLRLKEHILGHLWQRYFVMAKTGSWSNCYTKYILRHKVVKNIKKMYCIIFFNNFIKSSFNWGAVVVVIVW